MKVSGDTVINHEGIVQVNSGKSVIVSISSSSACAGCHAKGSCNTLGTEEKLVEINGTYNVKTGDIVTILMKQSMGFKALLLGYVIPFISVMIVLITMVSFKFPELIAGLTSLAVLLPYYLLLFIFRKRLNEKFTFALKV